MFLDCNVIDFVAVRKCLKDLDALIKRYPNLIGKNRTVTAKDWEIQIKKIEAAK